MTDSSPAALLAKMDDIHGLDPIGIWPPGIGWWIVFALFIVIVFFCTRAFIHARSWKGDAGRTLKKITTAPDSADARVLATDLAELMRRIAMARFSRAEAAGLQGTQWLDWLRRHDPKGFNWEKQGRPLIDAPYSPPDAVLSVATIRELAKAARAWVR